MDIQVIKYLYIFLDLLSCLISLKIIMKNCGFQTSFHIEFVYKFGLNLW